MTEVDMHYPQGNFYPQGAFGPQAFQNNPQGSFYPQGTFGPQAIQSNPGNIPFANTLYGYPQQNYPQQTPTFPQQTPTFAQGSNWQHPALQQQQQAALQQQAIQQLLAHQLAAQQLAAQQPSAINAFAGLSNGAAQTVGAWTQQQPNPEQINPALTPRHHLLQQLAQYHYLVAQQLAQIAAQLAVQGSFAPYAGQFMGAGQFTPGQLGANFMTGPVGANFVPGITMH
jgi:hypothetical protein